MAMSERKVPFIQLLRLEKTQQFTKSTYSTGCIGGSLDAFSKHMLKYMAVPGFGL